MIKSVSTLLAVSLSLLVAFSVESAPSGKPGQTVAVDSESSFCLLLPKDRGGKIGESEDSAISFCTTDSLASSLKAKTLPQGFITSAHITHGDGQGWIQVSGLFDRSKYGLDPNDGGGQYDVAAPRGSSCAGYKAFVQITEPNTQRYCLRCCHDPSNCPRGRSTDGCKDVLGGDYS